MEIRDISDEIPFDIPDSWEWVRLGTVLSIFGRIGFRGYTKADMTIKGNGAITISPSNIKGTDTFFDDCTYISWAKYDESPEIQIENEDLLLVKTGSSYGKCGIVLGLPEKATINPQLVVLKYILISRKWILYALNSSLAKKQYEQFVIGTSIPTFSQEKLSSLIIPVPPLAEQHRIVSKIEELMPYIEKYDKTKTQLTTLTTTFPEALKKSILQEAVQGKLVPQNPDDEPASVLLERIRAEKQALIKAGKIKKDKHESIIFRRDNSHYEMLDGMERCIDDEIPFEIPDSWQWVRLNDIGTYKKGPFGSSLTKGMFVSKSKNTVKVYEQKNAIKKDHTLGSYYITKEYYEKSMKNFSVFPGDIIVSCAGTIGEAYVLPDNIEVGIINQALMRMTIFAPIDIDYFLLYFDYVLKQSAIASSKGSAIKNIPPFKIFKQLLLPLPPLAEQHRIVSIIDKIMPFIENLAK